MVNKNETIAEIYNEFKSCLNCDLQEASHLVEPCKTCQQECNTKWRPKRVK